MEARVVRGPLPALRGRDHVLAGGRGGEAARGTAVRSGRGGGDPLAPGRVGRRDERRRDRVGVPQAARGAGAAGRGLRRHPVGRGDVPRSGRVDRAALESARRFCSCAWPGRSSSSGAPVGRGRCGSSRCPPEDADALIGDAVAGELRERIARAAAGNPLFISEMLAMAAEEREVEVPPTLKALLAARLDQLDEAERRVLERGSVEGEIFHRGARAGARSRGDAGHDPARSTRAAPARPPRPRPARRRRRLPLPPPADPRRRLRRAPQGGPRRPARPLRRLARRARRRAGRARRDRRLPPRAGSPIPGGARAARPQPRRPRRRAARCRRQARDRPPGLPGRGRAAHPGGRARTTTPTRRRARARVRMGTGTAIRLRRRDGGSGHRTRRGRW